MERPILTDPTRLCIPSKEWDGEINQILCIDLLDTARANSKRCLGLTANQIGILERYFVIAVGDLQLVGDLVGDVDYHVIINPQVVAVSKEKKIGHESCLSLPGRSTKIKRHKWIIIRYTDMTGALRKEKFKGISSIIVQHELNHMKGILI